MPYNQITVTGAIAPGVAPTGPDAKQIRDLIDKELNSNGFIFKWVSKNKQPYREAVYGKEEFPKSAYS